MTEIKRVERTSVHNYQIEFATALSAESKLRVYPIDANNRMTTPGLPWSPEVADGAYAVRLCRGQHLRALAFDFDVKLEQFAGQAAADADFVRRALERVGVLSVMAASGLGGGRHLFVNLLEPGLPLRQAWWLAQKLRSICKTLDVSPLTGSGAAIRPPLTPHRRGGRSELIGMSNEVALATLRDAQDPERIRLLTAALPGPLAREPLPKMPTSALERGSESGDGTDRSGSVAVMRLAMEVANASSTFGSFKQTVQTRAVGDSAVAASLRRRSDPRELDQWLKRAWEKAQKRVAAKPAVHQADDTAVLEAWSKAVQGVTHNTGRRAAEALLDLARQYDRALVGITVRDLAATTNMSRGSAERGLKWLVSGGLIEMVVPGTGRRAARYRLQPPSSWTCDAGGTVGSLPRSGGREEPTVPRSSLAFGADDVTLDIWSSQGLGEAARQTYAAVVRLGGRDARVSVAALADDAGVGVRAMQQRLKNLSDVGLARNLGGGYWAYECRNMEDLAQEIGAAGARSRILAQNHIERMANLEFHFRDMLQFLLQQDNWRHLADLAASAQPENRSQTENVAVPVTPMKIILPAPAPDSAAAAPANDSYTSSLLHQPAFVPVVDGGLN